VRSEAVPVHYSWPGLGFEFEFLLVGLFSVVPVSRPLFPSKPFFSSVGEKEPCMIPPFTTILGSGWFRRKGEF